ncbi:lysophospholipase-like protein 1 isoform X2 [Planococcus citri]|uniref:lysophospholipase-like protein 1 isoform X2 n=1 Tax=Planococcus citri TaxID=170843 RepID=UPI0031F92DBB
MLFKQIICHTYNLIWIGSVLFIPAESRKTKAPKWYYKKTDTVLQKEDEILPTGKHTGTIFFLHGLGGTGKSFRQTFESMKTIGGLPIPHPYLKLVFLTAPYGPCKAFPQELRVYRWYDIPKIHINASEILWDYMEYIIWELKQFAQKENNEDIHWFRIGMGGFSQGASMAMIAGYSYLWKMGGVFALSGYINYKSGLWEEMTVRKRHRYPKLFGYHGVKDDMVLYEWGKYTFDELQSRGIEGEFHSDPELRHRISVNEAKALFDWLNTTFPAEFRRPTPTWTWTGWYP